jgi:hypothetical protein
MGWNSDSGFLKMLAKQVEDTALEIKETSLAWWGMSLVPAFGRWKSITNLKPDCIVSSKPAKTA